MIKKNLFLSLVFIFVFTRCGDGNGGEEDTAEDPSLDLTEDRVTETPADPQPDEVVGEMDVEVDDVSIEEIAGDPPMDTVEIPDAMACEDGGCTAPLLCCDGRCVHPLHDPDHCSGCHTACPSSTPFCDYGTCTTTPCEATCVGITECCGNQCCELGQICCHVEGAGPSIGPGCYDDFCPPGCPWCV